MTFVGRTTRACNRPLGGFARLAAADAQVRYTVREPELII
jgi:hypothetical protein